jgi:hypothetical protein
MPTWIDPLIRCGLAWRRTDLTTDAHRSAAVYSVSDEGRPDEAGPTSAPHAGGSAFMPTLLLLTTRRVIDTLN